MIYIYNSYINIPSGLCRLPHASPVDLLISDSITQKTQSINSSIVIWVTDPSSWFLSGVQDHSKEPREPFKRDSVCLARTNWRNRLVRFVSKSDTRFRSTLAVGVISWFSLPSPQKRIIFNDTFQCRKYPMVTHGILTVSPTILDANFSLLELVGTT